MRHAITTPSVMCGLVLGTALGSMPPSGAFAHGAPASIREVIARDAEGPWLVGLTEGFAVREPDAGFRFLCPARLGRDLPPPAHAVGQQAFIVGADDAYRVQVGSSLEAAGQVGLAASRVLALSARDGLLFALRFADDSLGTELVELRDGELRVVLREAVVWSALAAAGERLWLGRVLGAQDGEAGIELRSFDRDGTGVTWRTRLEAPLGLWITTAGDDVFVHVLQADGYRLLQVNDDGPALEVARSVAPILGPVARGASRWLVRDGALLELHEEGLVAVQHPLADVRGLTCLDSSYACSQHAVFAIDTVREDASVAAPELLFDLFALREPTTATASADEATERECRAQWLVFRSDIARLSERLGGDAGVSDPVAGQAVDSDESGDAGSERPSRGRASCAAVGAAHGRPGAGAAAWGMGFALAGLARRARCVRTRREKQT